MIVQYPNRHLNRMAIESSLRMDEEIACDNATVIVDKNGNVTGWFDNDVPVCVITKEE